MYGPRTSRCEYEIFKNFISQPPERKTNKLKLTIENKKDLKILDFKITIMLYKYVHGNCRVLNIIERLEKKLNMTVLSSNQALIWETLENINRHTINNNQQAKTT